MRTRKGTAAYLDFVLYILTLAERANCNGNSFQFLRTTATLPASQADIAAEEDETSNKKEAEL